jgi:dolichyl-phosphate-mannose-protein mannosyltransferase
MGESFYLDLGSVVNVKSLGIVVADGTFNITVSTGSPSNWNISNNALGPLINEQIPNWQEISVNKSTQYVKVDFGYTGKLTAKLSQVAVISQNDEVAAIKSITNVGDGSRQLQNLIDEQNLISYPFNRCNLIFDEIYYVPSAKEYLNLQIPSEAVEPPLGKLIIASSIQIFGFSAFGWRMMTVIFSTLIIALVYLLGKELFESWVGGFAAAFLLCFDFMHFTLARLAMLDSFVVFFSLASQLFFFIYLKNVLKKGWGTSVTPLVLSIFLFGLGFSTKWIVLFGFLGEMALLVFLKLHDIWGLKETLLAKVRAFGTYPWIYVVFSLVASVWIYFLTYIPDMLAGRSYAEVWNLQFSMLGFHSEFTTPHPWASPWFSWPFMFNPLNSGAHVTILFFNQNPLLTLGSFSGFGESEILMGNPAVWWVGFAAILSLTAIALRKFATKKFSLRDNLLLASLVFIFFCQWLVYIFIARITFIYYFYGNVPLLCLASAYFISKYWEHKWMKILAVIYFALVVALFILFSSVI